MTESALLPLSKQRKESGSCTSQRLPLMPKPTKEAPEKRGPKADLLKIDGDWKDAVKKSLEKKKPVTGWPKEK